MLKQKIALRFANELRCVARQFAVGDFYARNLVAGIRRGLIERGLHLRVRVEGRDDSPNRKSNGGANCSDRTAGLHDVLLLAKKCSLSG
jgi:hypothetical protein